MPNPFEVTKLAHVALGALDMNKQAEFYVERWGLDRIDEHGGQLFLRGDCPQHHIVELNASGKSGIDHVALEVASADDVERAADFLSGQGVEIVTPPTKELEPGIAKSMRVRDPEGNVVELVAGVDTVTDAYGSRDVKPKGLNHVVLWAKDMPAMETFYRDTLGFQQSDAIANFMTFWRCNANHHSIALCPAREGQTGLHHAAFDTKDWQEFMSAVFWMGERGVQRFWGPGRHTAGNNLFSYYHDPEGNTVEWTSEVEQITDPNYVAPLRQPGPKVTDQWGSMPPGAPPR
ncbi:MAG TPA: VOC family protein [Chloroflexota bacterium]|jgi:catechol 2,3-dioxygenase-like lactoylglutathione lyase family enzyme